MRGVEIEIRRSALRHHISEERIRYVVEHCATPLFPPPDDGDDADLIWFIGPDRNGIELEILAIDEPGGGVKVIHAMSLRDWFRDDYARVVGWPKQR